MLVIVVILVQTRPNRSMGVAAEMAVVRELQFTNTTQTEYKSQVQRYATTLAELGLRGANPIPSTLASGDNDGYVLILTATPAGYTIHANPESVRHIRPPDLLYRPGRPYSTELVRRTSERQ